MMDSDNLNRLIKLEIDNAVETKFLEIRKASKRATIFASIAFGYFALNIVVLIIIFFINLLQ